MSFTGDKEKKKRLKVLVYLSDLKKKMLERFLAFKLSFTILESKFLIQFSK